MRKIIRTKTRKRVIALTVPKEVRQRIEEIAESEDRTLSYISSLLIQKGLELREPNIAKNNN